MNQREKQERAQDERDFASLRKSPKQLLARGLGGRRIGVPTRNKRKRAEQRNRAGYDKHRYMYR